MNYEQKYKKALERARHYYKANLKFLADIFPELQEPGDTSRQATEGLAGSSSDAHHSSNNTK